MEWIFRSLHASAFYYSQQKSLESNLCLALCFLRQGIIFSSVLRLVGFSHEITHFLCLLRFFKSEFLNMEHKTTTKEYNFSEAH